MSFLYPKFSTQHFWTFLQISSSDFSEIVPDDKYKKTVWNECFRFLRIISSILKGRVNGSFLGPKLDISEIGSDDTHWKVVVLSDCFIYLSSPRISEFLQRQMKCQGNYMKIHFASAFPRQCFLPRLAGFYVKSLGIYLGNLGKNFDKK